MSLMVVTLEVSKLSGWLNADANCRESEREAYVRYVRRSARCGLLGGRRRRATAAQAACVGEGSTAWEERTLNMLLISVMPEVSKLSG